jgi:cell division protein FtsA
MDVGGGTTDIAVVNDDGVQGTKMFGIGGRAYTNSVARELDLEFGAAEQLKLEAAGGGTLSKDKAGKVDSALRKTLDVWSSGVELALGEFTKLDHLPHRVFLCGGGAILPMLMDHLQHRQWHQELPFTRQPVVQHIKPGQVVGISDTTDEITDHTFVTAMGLLRVGLDTMHYSGAADNNIKEKLDRMLRV